MISMMNNNCDLEKKSDQVSEGIPLFELESPPAEEETVIPSDVVDENTSNGGVSGPDDDIVDVSTESVKEEGLEDKAETRVSDNLQSSGGNDVVIVEPDETGFEKKEPRALDEFDSKEMDEKKSRVFDKVDSRETNEKGSKVSVEISSREQESRVSEIEAEEIKRKPSSNVGDSGLRAKTEERAEVPSGETCRDGEMILVNEKPTVLDFSSAYSMVDEARSARVSEDLEPESEKGSGYGFEPGDMVWGKVKSHPWWPGQIFNEAFASSSVRRSKREGHLLVAFFGDSSYGWFNPEELVHFDPHYAEKSRQTNSRIFVRAVEEAVDEARRRAALRLTCYCRNPFKFRPSNVQGYFAVDVVDYEAGGIYSAKQIKEARSNFVPSDALSFVQQLALNPRDYDQTGIDSIKNVAMFHALRRATFEEFDETYGQAFGAPPGRTTRDSMPKLDQHDKVPSRAPLSGPMVIAEALGDKKGYSKPSKIKDQSKKEKYVLKKRDKPNKAGNYIFQKRTSDALLKPQNLPAQDNVKTISQGDYTLTYPGSGQESETLVRKVLVSEPSMDYPQNNLNSDMNVLHEISDGATPNRDVVSTSANLDESVVLPRTGASGSGNSSGQNLQQESSAVDLSMGSAKPSIMSESPVQSKQALKDPSGPDGVWGFGNKVIGTNFDGVIKKGKVLKHPKNLSSDKTGAVEKKIKKKRKLDPETLEDHPHKFPRTPKDGESVRNSAGKSIGVSSSQKKNDGGRLSDSILGSPPKIDLVKVELPQLVDDLLALAIDPFHGVERNSPTIVAHTILQFRSLVYQKAAAYISTGEAETSESSENRSHAVAASTKMPLIKKPTDQTSKLQKPFARPDDPTKAGKKRSLSDRQEEKAAKRVKKINELKLLTTEKKGGSQKLQEPKQGERKESSLAEQKKPTIVNVVKKPEPSAKASGPGMLSLKFPPQTTLPSVPELKARFARFGPLDHSAFRVFWQTLTCRVVFKNKSHAVAAYNYAQRNNLFGQVRVNYQLRDVAAPAAETPEKSSERQVDDGSPSEVPSIRQGLLQQRSQLQQSPVQLKSCLKKPSGEETGPNSDGVPRENPRVRFKLVENDSRKEEMIFSSNNNSDMKSKKIGSNEGALMDASNKNFRKVIPQTQIPPPSSFNNQSSSSFDVNESYGISHFPKSSPYLHHLSQVQVEEQMNYNNAHQSTNPNKTDISTQMLSLLMRCNDIVMGITSSLGYVAYHSL